MKNLEIKSAFNVVELEDRFEMTVAAVDSARCGDNSDVTVSLSAL